MHLVNRSFPKNLATRNRTSLGRDCGRMTWHYRFPALITFANVLVRSPARLWPDKNRLPLWRGF